MLTLSTRVRYAARAILDISLNNSGQPISVAEIAKRQGISVKYMEGIMPALRTSGLVSSTKGANGGYTLNRRPSEITLLDILCALYGPVQLAEGEDKNHPGKRRACEAICDVWNEISDIINKELASITIEDIVKRQLKKNSTSYVYYI